MAFLAVDDGSIFYQEVGEGPSIVWVHGLPLCSDAWEPQLTSFRARYRNVAYDLRGCGRSTKLPADGADLVGLHVSDLKHVVGTQPVILVGHAFGGHLAMTFAAQYPELVQKLVLINASPYFRRTQGWQHGYGAASIKAIHRLVDSSGVEGLIAHLLSPYKVFKDMNPNVAGVLFATYAQMALSAGKDTLLAFFDHMALHDARPLLSAIESPTLIISSQRGGEVVDEVAFYLRRQIEDAVMAEIPGADHFVFATRPTLVNSLISAFVRG